MPYPDNYDDAHRRHWRDAEILFEKGRFANADYLYGLSAECALKATMRRLGMRVDDGTGAPEAKYRKHLPELWRLFVNFVNERRGALLSGECRDRTPFSGWRIGDRYAKASCFCRQRVEPHRDAARRIRDMCGQASWDESS